MRDSADIVVAARDGVLGLLLRKIELVGAEFRILQQVDKDFEDVIKIAF